MLHIRNLMMRLRRGVAKFTPMQIIALVFMLIILVGTGLLMLPIAARDRQATPFLTALFTATSCTCVTGLALVDS